MDTVRPTCSFQTNDRVRALDYCYLVRICYYHEAHDRTIACSIHAGLYYVYLFMMPTTTTEGNTVTITHSNPNPAPHERDVNHIQLRHDVSIVLRHHPGQVELGLGFFDLTRHIRKYNKHFILDVRTQRRILIKGSMLSMRTRPTTGQDLRPHRNAQSFRKTN